MAPKPLSTDALNRVVGGTLIRGGAGDDTIQGSARSDIISAGSGNDYVSSGAGDDTVYGDDGNDILFAGADRDVVIGGRGDDIVDGGAGQDRLFGGDGNDVLAGGVLDGEEDVAYGEAGDDTYLWTPGDGSDRFWGGTDTDQLHERSEQDTLKIVGMSLHDLQSSLHLDGNTNLQMQLNGDMVTFTDTSGRPATFGGTINFGGETLRFAEVERIQLG